MQLSFSTDPLIWDNTESVTLTSTRDGGDMVDVIDDVLRRALTGRELAASGGVYTGDDVNFIVPAIRCQALEAQGRLPKPGDLVTTWEGDSYTVLSSNGMLRDQAGYQAIKLTTRNLVLAYDLRESIDIEAPTITLDDAGVKRKRWPPGSGSVPYKNLPAKVQLLSEDVMTERGLMGFKGSHAVIVGRQVALNLEWRIRWNDHGTIRYLDLVDLKNPGRLDELPVIGAELRP